MMSGRLYSLVTNYWPRIAAGLVVVISLLEFVVGGLTADSGLEIYLVAWAGTTGGMWFLFEKAEGTLSDEARITVSTWVRKKDPTATLQSIPDQFADLFDRVFGQRHLTTACAARSFLASSVTVAFFAIVLPLPQLDYVHRAKAQDLGAMALLVLPWLALWTRSRILGKEWLSARMEGRLLGFKVGLTRSEITLALLGASAVFLALVPTTEPPPWEAPARFHAWYSFLTWAGILHLSVLVNFIPDYVSLLETRWALRFARTDRRLPLILLIDFIATALISLACIWGFFAFLAWLQYPPTNVDIGSLTSVANAVIRAEGGVFVGWERLYFLTAFMTSVWLWLYAASVPLSRVLLKMNEGVGFLLRVTDVENQPFRSMGFVSVLIVSGLFLLGLPFVLF